MTTEFVLIRHGETAWNLERRYQGTSDTPLNARGHRQAEGLADEMRGEHWDVMASSPLHRAWDTAMPIADAVGIPRASVIPDDRLIERHYGVAEGFTLEEREYNFPGEIWDGLESREDLSIRAMAVMEDYASRFANQKIILVTHGTWITSVLEILTAGEFGYGKSVILNTSRTFISKDDAGWNVADISVASHLAAAQ